MVMKVRGKVKELFLGKVITWLLALILETSGIILDEKLNFKEQLKEKMSKANKGVAVLRKLQNIMESSQWNYYGLLLLIESMKPRQWIRRICYFQNNIQWFTSIFRWIHFFHILWMSGEVQKIWQSHLNRT